MDTENVSDGGGVAALASDVTSRTLRRTAASAGGHFGTLADRHVAFSTALRARHDGSLGKGRGGDQEGTTVRCEMQPFLFRNEKKR